MLLLLPLSEDESVVVDPLAEDDLDVVVVFVVADVATELPEVTRSRRP